MNFRSETIYVEIRIEKFVDAELSGADLVIETEGEGIELGELGFG